MAILFKQYLSLGGDILSVVKQLRKQRKFLSRHIAPVLSNARDQNDGSLTETDFKKITHYYGWAVPAILGEAFCVLNATPMREHERWSSTCQGAMTGLFDDFFDKDYMEEEKVKTKISSIQDHINSRSNEKLFDWFYKKALTTVPDSGLMQTSLLAVHDAQVKSKKQVDPQLSWEELEAITYEKGGTSLLFYRSAFAPPASGRETALLYHLGASMQLCNDIFDVYKDRDKKIRTLMTETRKVDKIRSLLLERLNHAYQEAYHLSYSRANIRRFLNNLSIGVFSRAFVCLDHLEANEKFSNGYFEVHEYNRAQLICDMDIKKNMLRSAAYHLKTIR